MSPLRISEIKRIIDEFNTPDSKFVYSITPRTIRWGRGRKYTVIHFRMLPKNSKQGFAHQVDYSLLTDGGYVREHMMHLIRYVSNQPRVKP